jgi:hypothetical protein
MVEISYFFNQASGWLKHLCTILCLLSISLSVVSLHYSEAIENDGLTFCKAIDSEAESCKKSEKEDNDNDNETVRVMGELDTLKQFQLVLPSPSNLDLLVPEYNNSYLFAFLSELNRPPASVI